MHHSRKTTPPASKTAPGHRPCPIIQKQKGLFMSLNGAEYGRVRVGFLFKVLVGYSFGSISKEGTTNCYAERLAIGLYMLLPPPILCGMYCNKGRSGGNTVLRNSAGAEGGGWGAQTKWVLANNSIDSCAKA